MNGQGVSTLLRRMTTRTPSSLKWMIDLRARLSGEIKKAELATTRATRLLGELKRIQKDLRAVDRTLGLHDIKVDVSLIQPVQSHSGRIDLPYGELTRSVLFCLRLNPDRPMRTFEIVAFVAARCADLDAPQQSTDKLHASVRHRLKNLVAEGIVERHHPMTGSAEGMWSIAKPMR